MLYSCKLRLACAITHGTQCKFYRTTKSQVFLGLQGIVWQRRKATVVARAALPSPTGACWVFSCFRNPPTSDMDYRIFNVRTGSLCVCIHTGVRHTDIKSAQHFWLRKTLAIEPPHHPIKILSQKLIWSILLNYFSRFLFLNNMPIFLPFVYLPLWWTGWKIKYLPIYLSVCQSIHLFLC